MVAAASLRDGVGQHRLEHSQPVAHRRGARQVDHDSPAGQPGDPSESIAVGTPAATPAARMASAMPGACRSSTASVASGVPSVGVRPVPPVVSTTSGSEPTASRARLHRRAVRHHDRFRCLEAPPPQGLDHERAAAVLVDAGRGPVEQVMTTARGLTAPSSPRSGRPTSPSPGRR